jgi:UDP-N-acetylglucosamine:LPS N-acetylglucosamine transferase
LVLGGSLGQEEVNQLIERTGKHLKPECSNYMAMQEVIFWEV